MRRIPWRSTTTNAFIRVQPGVINLDVSKQHRSPGLVLRARSVLQSVCSIGGNVAENSGGAHCLKYGFNVNHTLGMRMVLYDGSVVDIGGPGSGNAPG